MTIFNITLETANWLYAIGWWATLIGALVTAGAVALSMWATRVRDRDFESQIAATHAAAANANERAAQANERAATLEKEAALLRIELEREVQKRAPRQLAEEPKAELIAGVRGKISKITLVVQRDAEAQQFALQLMFALSEAGVTLSKLDMPPGVMLTAPAGVLMYRPGGANTEADMKNDPLYLALKKADLYGGFSAKPFASLELGPGEPKLLPEGHIIYVGQKAP